MSYYNEQYIKNFMWAFGVSEYHYYNNQYLLVLICFIVAAALSILIMTLYKIITATDKYIDTIEKVSGFECGFVPYSESRSKFFIKFFIVAVLFLLFDLEVVILFPIMPFLYKTYFLYKNTSVLIFFFSFILILFLGIFYEFKKNVLDWF